MKTIRLVIVSLTLLVIGFGAGYSYRGNGKAVARPLSRENLDFTLFWNVWDELERKYVDTDKLDPQKMVYGAISGMTAAVGDPYTVFLPPSDNQAAKEDLNGEFGGVGIQLGYKKDTLAVMTTLDGHPAIKQGVKAGDLILHIKDPSNNVDKETADMAITEAVRLIRGKKGTTVTLTLYREEKGKFDVTMERDTIQIPGVELEFGELKDNAWVKNESGSVAWLKVHRFGDRADTEWNQAVQKIVARKASLKGVVLDVRNNPGGYVNAAVDMASEFIPDGLVVTQQGRTESRKFNVSKRGELIGTPTVVLINGGSASASEILAGALRDRLKLQLVGEKSFGKGTMQEAMDLPNNAGLHVTIARWLLPSGDWIHESGLKPDIEVEMPESGTASASAETMSDPQLSKAIEVLGTRR